MKFIFCYSFVSGSNIDLCYMTQGVLHTFGSLQAQMVGMITAWGWNANDCVLHVLPLHHIHGIVNVLMTPLFCGALCVMMPHFDSREVPIIFLCNSIELLLNE